MNKQSLKNQNGTLIIYSGTKGRVELRADTDMETIWASEAQIADVFSIDRSVAGKHIRNILADRELDRNSVCANFAHTAKDGKRYSVIFYNLDVILAVGYRTNSSKAIKFRQWATKILRNYLTKGFEIDSTKMNINTERFQDLRDAVSFIESKTAGRVKGKITLKLTKEII